MFGQQRSTFGTTGTSFGASFGTPNTTTATTGFGTSSFGRFGTPQPTTSFGTSTTPFGAATSSTTSLFGTQPQQSGGGLFGTQQTQPTSTGFSHGTSGFGSTSGGGLFGQTQQPGTGLFGTSGTSGFGAQQSTQNRPFGFGQTTTSTTTTGGLFGSTPSTGGGLFGTTPGFGGAGGAVSGTTVKYEPVTGSDTMTRNGVSTNIRTRIEVITAMKEYENKSMEELRVEDYLANRKGQGQGGGLGGFGQAQQPGAQPQLGTSGGLFSSNTGTSLFGTKPPENKSLFGTPSADSNTSGLLEAVSCGVCSEVYERARKTPLVLPCGHTFCVDCLTAIEKQCSISCPECRSLHKNVQVSALSVNFSLLGILPLCTDFTDFTHDKCKTHGDDLRYWCCTCDLPLCGLCLYSGHPQGHTVKLATSFVQEKKTELVEKIKFIFEDIENTQKKLKGLFSDIDALMKKLFELNADLQGGVVALTDLSNTQKASDITSILNLENGVKNYKCKLNVPSDIDVSKEEKVKDSQASEAKAVTPEAKAVTPEAKAVTPIGDAIRGVNPSCQSEAD